MCPGVEVGADVGAEFCVERTWETEGDGLLSKLFVEGDD